MGLARTQRPRGDPHGLEVVAALIDRGAARGTPRARHSCSGGLPAEEHDEATRSGRGMDECRRAACETRTAWSCTPRELATALGGRSRSDVIVDGAARTRARSRPASSRPIVAGAGRHATSRWRGRRGRRPTSPRPRRRRHGGGGAGHDRCPPGRRRLARTRLPARVIGVTGSVGKTSVKDLLAAVLAERWATSASLRSFNNELGVPPHAPQRANGTEALVSRWARAAWGTSRSCARSPSRRRHRHARGRRAHGGLRHIDEVARPRVSSSRRCRPTAQPC